MVSMLNKCVSLEHSKARRIKEQRLVPHTRGREVGAVVGMEGHQREVISSCCKCSI